MLLDSRADGATAGTVNSISCPIVFTMGTSFVAANNAAFTGIYDGRDVLV